ncbi:MAG: haloacid dehalogenase type II [Planctomycetes bacterium]|nr:haloacid dehalogenase type II [Planctomycetota bacterium]
MAEPKAVVFDAYGTLFDVRAIAAPEPLLTLWRQKQLEYTWLRSLMGRFEDFERVTLDALRFASKKLGIPADESLAKAWRTLPPFPEVDAALQRLHGRPLTILSNGTQAMLDDVVRAAKLAGHFQHILSVDAVRRFKPSPSVYALATQALGFEAKEILFVSSNGWDAAGAKSAGFTVCWVNRLKAPAEELGAAADYVVESLDQLPDKVFK